MIFDEHMIESQTLELALELGDFGLRKIDKNSRESVLHLERNSNNSDNYSFRNV